MNRGVCDVCCGDFDSAIGSLIAAAAFSFSAVAGA